jgi:hypothetical protein
MQFSLVRLIVKILSKPNQCGLNWFGWCGLQHNISIPNNFKHPKKEFEVPK